MNQELARRDQPGALTPKDVVTNATEQARLLMDIVDKTGCFKMISGKKYLQVEAWETIGAFNRVHAVTEYIAPIMRDGDLVGYDAKVILINHEGQEVGGAVMPCYFTENACQGKEGDAKDKAAKSAAQTFATSKAYRMNYSYVAILAGYQPTPAEEMTGEAPDDRPASQPKGHYCTQHQVVFFKRGKMQKFAHPIGDTGQWCNEGDDIEPDREHVASPDIQDEAPRPIKGKTPVQGSEAKTTGVVTPAGPPANKAPSPDAGAGSLGATPATLSREDVMRWALGLKPSKGFTAVCQALEVENIDQYQGSPEQMKIDLAQAWSVALP